MKLIFKLIVVGLIANGTWRLGTTYSSHYRFKDAVRDFTQHRGEKSDAEVHDRVFELASQYDIPVTDENLTITKKDKHTIVEGAYTKPITLAPGFVYDWPFTVHVDTFILEPQKFDGSPVR